MDTEMAFLMANQTQAKPGKFVYEPFVGTGSILVAASHFGAVTMVFDAIICDPPYPCWGRKSGGRKVLKGVVGPYTVLDDKRTDHIPSTAPYGLVECVHDLLDLAPLGCL